MGYLKYLKKRNVISILDGDQHEDFKLRSGSIVKIHLPYLSGPDICEIFSYFNVAFKYNSGLSKGWSRNHYMRMLFNCGDDNLDLNDMLTYFLNPKRCLAQYHSDSYNLSYKEIHDLSKLTIVFAIRNINDQLSDCDYKLIERNMKVSVAKTNAVTFDDFLKLYDDMYTHQSAITGAVIMKEKPHDDSLKSIKNIPNISIYNSNSNSITVNNCLNLNISELNKRIGHNVNTLDSKLVGSDKQNFSYAIKCVENEKYHKALDYLKKISSRVVESAKVLKSFKFMFNLCKLFI